MKRKEYLEFYELLSMLMEGMSGCAKLLVSPHYSIELKRKIMKLMRPLTLQEMLEEKSGK